MWHFVIWSWGYLQWNKKQMKGLVIMNCFNQVSVIWESAVETFEFWCILCCLIVSGVIVNLHHNRDSLSDFISKRNINDWMFSSTKCSFPLHSISETNVERCSYAWRFAMKREFAISTGITLRTNLYTLITLYPW